MNCFEWQSRASDYLDGAMNGASKREADEHIEGCRDCNERYKHYRLILTSIASQPRSALPVPIRKSPFSAILPRLEPTGFRAQQGLAGKFPWWERIPWYVRIPIEGAGIVLVILVGISVGPKLRLLYEQRMERSLNEYSDSVTGVDGSLSGAASVPLARGKVEAPADGEDFSASEGEGDSESSESADDSEAVHAGSSEVWRFNLKTDSPHEFRPKIVQVLTELGVSSQTSGFGGIEAPGGIQFDLFVAQGMIPEMKKRLEKIAPTPPEDAGDSPNSETFTWYKNRSKKPIPRGQTRVVIWLSQI